MYAECSNPKDAIPGAKSTVQLSTSRRNTLKASVSELALIHSSGNSNCQEDARFLENLWTNVFNLYITATPGGRRTGHKRVFCLQLLIKTLQFK